MSDAAERGYVKLHAEVGSVVDWLVDRVDRDGLIDKRVLETNFGNVAIFSAFAEEVAPYTRRTGVVVDGFLIGVAGGRTRLSVPNARAPLYFTVRPLSPGIIKLEWECFHPAMSGYLAELLEGVRLDFAVVAGQPELPSGNHLRDLDATGVMERITSRPIKEAMTILVSDPDFFGMREGIREEVRRLAKWPDALDAFKKAEEVDNPPPGTQRGQLQWHKECEQRLFQAVRTKYLKLQIETNEKQINKS